MGKAKANAADKTQPIYKLKANPSYRCQYSYTPPSTATS